MAKELLDYFREYSYTKKNPELLEIYQRMWEGGYRLGEYGRYLRKPSQFDEGTVFPILRDIGFWKSGQRWVAKGFDKDWSLPKIRRTLRSITNSILIFGTPSNLVDIIAVNRKTKIRGFGKRAGSVILAVMYPELYGILDYKVWRALNNRWIEHYSLDFLCKFKEQCKNCYKTSCRYIQGTANSTDFTSEECEQYFKGVREIAALENMNPRQVDMALWEYDEQQKCKQA